MTFGKRLRASRNAKGFTQKQLADKIGAKHNSISDWENDKNKPDPDTIELLCGVLEITPNYLLNTNSEDFSPLEKEIIKKYRALDEHGKELVDTILDKEYTRNIDIVVKADGKEDIIIEKNTPPAERLRKTLQHIQKLPVAAHERTDVEITEEMIKHDDDIMDDENF